MNKITKRWFVNNFVVILIVLVMMEIIISFGIKSFYYNNVEKFIKSQATMVLNLIDRSYKDKCSNIDFEIKSIVEDFEQKDKMEMMLLKSDGTVLITSSGFEGPLKSEMPDYRKMKKIDYVDLDQIRGTQAIYLLNDENVMAITYPIYTKISNVSYLRFVCSITEVDKQIVAIIAFSALIGICIVFFVMISSSYFIQSIVIPVDEIGRVARKITQGDLNIRLKRQTDDEIGDLCDTINNMAEELSMIEKMKNEFISSISHELKTPLTAVKGWAETIENCDVSDEKFIKKGIKVIINEAHRLSGMVDELLDFSRLQNGNMRLALSKLDIVAELEDMIIIFEERAKKEEIVLISKFSKDCIPIMGDSNRLKQVFTNILDNALKYSDKGSKVIVSVEKELEFALIKVIDSGCGINPCDISKVKTKFYKANYSKRGSGIGLSVADEIVRLHNGSLDIYSIEGKGTTVVIQLPLYK